MHTGINHNTHTGPSFALRNRFARLVWQLCYYLLFRPTPRPMHRWRAFLLRCFGATVGRGVHVYPRVQIWAPWNLRLDDRCGVGNGAILYSQGAVHIGKEAVVSQGAHLCTGTHDYTLPGFPLLTSAIEIGAGAWIAAEAFIHPGVVIGEGAVIGARAVVTHNMPAGFVCAGHPCKPIKERWSTQWDHPEIALN